MSMMVITNSKGPQVFKNDAKSTKRPRNNIKKHKLTMFQSVRPLYSIKFNAIATWLWQLSLNSSLGCLNFKGILTSRYYAFSFYILLTLRELIDPTLGLKRNLGSPIYDTGTRLLKSGPTYFTSRKTRFTTLLLVRMILAFRMGPVASGRGLRDIDRLFSRFAKSRVQ